MSVRQIVDPPTSMNTQKLVIKHRVQTVAPRRKDRTQARIEAIWYIHYI
jgi:hypothetical protein